LILRASAAWTFLAVLSAAIVPLTAQAPRDQHDAHFSSSGCQAAGPVRVFIHPSGEHAHVAKQATPSCEVERLASEIGHTSAGFLDQE